MTILIILLIYVVSVFGFRKLFYATWEMDMDNIAIWIAFVPVFNTCFCIFLLYFLLLTKSGDALDKIGEGTEPKGRFWRWFTYKHKQK